MFLCDKDFFFFLALLIVKEKEEEEKEREKTHTLFWAQNLATRVQDPNKTGKIFPVEILANNMVPLVE